MPSSAQRLITPPSVAPIVLADVKARLRIDHDDDDDVIEGMISAAVDHLDGRSGVLGRCLISQTWDEFFTVRDCAGVWFELALDPVASITHVKYFDSAGAEQTLSSANYELVPETRRAFLHCFDPLPAVDTRRAYPLTVRVVAGFGAAAANVPPALIDALYLHVGTLYEHRDALESTTLSVMPLGYDDLIRPHRRLMV